MQQRIVINAPICEEESRKKGMKIASNMKGVMKVEVVKEKNHLVVVGEGIDSVKLVNSLRKKFCFANILTIHDHNNINTAPAADRICSGEDDPPRFRYNVQLGYYWPEAYPGYSN